jgi:hypothetical protein
MNSHGGKFVVETADLRSPELSAWHTWARPLSIEFVRAGTSLLNDESISKGARP